MSLRHFILFICLVCSINAIYSEDNEDYPAKIIKKWSQWTEWSPCSRSCGGGVTKKSRNCVTVVVENQFKNINLHQKYRKIQNKCDGEKEISRICNDQDCPDGLKDIRKQQCEYYNDKPFVGSYYNWEPYYPGGKNLKCSLTCRPIGYKSYATLNDSVIDGTPCGRLGEERHVCVSGICKSVGCDGVIGGQKYDACGICGGDNSSCRLISGLYTRPYLLPGYNYITEIPKFSCSLSIIEMKKTTNNLALRYKNGTYILNGNWTTSKSGSYLAAGTVFNFHKELDNMGNTIYASGPLTQSLDLLVLYKQTNPGIKYEYRLPSTVTFEQRSDFNNDESSLHVIEEASTPFFDNSEKTPKPVYAAFEGPVGDEAVKPKTKGKKKRFVWQITSYTECSKSCGGGTQMPIYSCVRESNHQIASDRKCTNFEKPNGIPLKCNIKPCPAHWGLTEWSECSSSCGEGVQTRKIICEQEISSKVTITVPNESCEGPIPNMVLTTHPCYQKPCGNSTTPKLKAYWQEGPWGPCSTHCGIGVKTRKVSCISQQDETCPLEEKPTSQSTCDMGPCAITQHVWLTTEWTDECPETCGTGIQDRKVFCSAGIDSENICDVNAKPESSRNCSSDVQCTGRWFSGPWSKCSEVCGWGKQYRTVICVSTTNGIQKIRSELICNEKDRPSIEQACLEKSCGSIWFIGTWGSCTRSCDGGIQRREIRCLDENMQPSKDCPEYGKPIGRRACNSHACAQTTGAPKGENELKKEEPSPKIKGMKGGDCEDNFNNCHLVVQARLCNYKYYQLSCCASCRNFNQISSSSPSSSTSSPTSSSTLKNQTN